MAEALLDFALLLAPIPGEQPAGGPVPYTLRQKLRAARKDTEPHPEDPSQPDVPRKVDWPGIVKMCQETLCETSKDLEVAMQLMEALTKLHGFAGVRDGLHLLQGLLTECWDRLHPIPEEGEGMEVRAERFHWIGETDRGAFFPGTLRNIPLVKIDNQPFSFQDRQLALEGRGSIAAVEFEKARPISDTVGEELAQSLEELGQLEQALQEKFANDSPSLMGLHQAVEDCSAFMQNILRRQVPAVVAGPTEETPGMSNGPVATLGGPRTGISGGRDEAYRQLDQIADYLEQLEPHSPIPDLLRRAIGLGRMPFRKLISELVREPNMLHEIRREFGIKEEASS